MARVPTMRRRSAVTLAGLVLWGTPLRAQLPEADSAWGEGRFQEARIAYEAAVRDDSSNVHANYRLAILASWDSHLDSALKLLRRARRIEPEDPDVRLAEARILAWKSDLRGSLRQYDSLITAHPERRDARLGRAQALAWDGRLREADAAYADLITEDGDDLEARGGQAQVSAWRGDLEKAERQYREILARDPRNATALIGLAQVHHWQGRERQAQGELRQAEAVDSTNHDGRTLAAAVRASIRPQVELGVGWSNDSDDNTSWWQTLGTSFAVGEGARAYGSVGALENSDPTRTAHRVSGEVGGSIARGNLGVNAALGLRNLSPGGLASRSTGTWRLSASYRLAPAASVGLGYARYPFDETALLVHGHVDVDALDLDLSATLREGLDAGLAAGLAWLSDPAAPTNVRRYLLGAVTQRVTSRASVGVLGRVLGYDSTHAGEYFSPDRFTTFEARASYTQPMGSMEARLSGGLGTQRVTSTGSSQLEWHLEGRISRRWAAINEVALSAGITNSAVSSTTGAFRYRTASLLVRLGL